MKNKGRAIFIVVLLAVLSLGTVYFSKMGLDFRKGQLSELKEVHGTIDFTSDYAYYRIVPTTLKNKVGVVSFVFEKEDIDPVMMQLARIHEQFDAREDVMIVTMMVKELSDSPAYIEEVFERNKVFHDLDQWVVNAGDHEMVTDLARDAYFIKDEQMDGPLHLLVDVEGNIRHFYDAENPEEVRKLIRHVTALLPRGSDPDIKVKR
jgi:hypothetical protein